MLKLYTKMQTALASLKDERGQDLIEYALLGALLAVACTAGIKSVATAVEGVFTSIVSSL
jgi:pilus assembly protein Flp/PilA